MFRVPEKYRTLTGALATEPNSGNNGSFMIPYSAADPGKRETLRVIASDGKGWEHVSVSLPNRCPTWEQMDFIKDLFWEPHECVMQLHPPRSNWVNLHPYCLHLWRPIGVEIPQPPRYMVG